MSEKNRKELLRELRRRRVINSTLLYALAVLMTWMIAGPAFRALGIPGYAIRYVWTAAALLFPLMLIFAWHYDLTLKGVRRNAPEFFPEDTQLFGADRVLITALAVIALGIIVVTLILIFQA